EYRRVRVKFAGGMLIYHFVDPDDSRSLRLCAFDGDPHLLPHLRRIWRGGAQYNLEIAIHKLDCAEQMLKPFLTRDPSDKKHVRLGGVDTVTLECRVRLDFMILVEINSVVNHVHTRR